jgi:hypothetical protein
MAAGILPAAVAVVVGVLERHRHRVLPMSASAPRCLGRVNGDEHCARVPVVQG